MRLLRDVETCLYCVTQTEQTQIVHAMSDSIVALPYEGNKVAAEFDVDATRGVPLRPPRGARLTGARDVCDIALAWCFPSSHKSQLDAATHILIGFLPKEEFETKLTASEASCSVHIAQRERRKRHQSEMPIPRTNHAMSLQFTIPIVI